jgi:hypothetical protein
MKNYLLIIPSHLDENVADEIPEKGGHISDVTGRSM